MRPHRNTPMHIYLLCGQSSCPSLHSPPWPPPPSHHHSISDHYLNDANLISCNCYIRSAGTCKHKLIVNNGGRRRKAELVVLALQLWFYLWILKSLLFWVGEWQWLSLCGTGLRGGGFLGQAPIADRKSERCAGSRRCVLLRYPWARYRGPEYSGRLFGVVCSLSFTFPP